MTVSVSFRHAYSVQGSWYFRPQFCSRIQDMIFKRVSVLLCSAGGIPCWIYKMLLLAMTRRLLWFLPLLFCMTANVINTGPWEEGDPVTLWHITAEDFPPKVASSIQWAVTSNKLCWCTVQQSIMVATWLTLMRYDIKVFLSDGQRPLFTDWDQKWTFMMQLSKISI